MQRTSHALVTAGGVWLVDAITDDDAEAAVAALGRAVGVISLMDRHLRDGADIAARLDVPFYVPSGRIRQEVPSARRFDHTIPDAPFTFLDIQRVDFLWHEVAMWWDEPEVLVVADAVGTASYFRSGEERLGVHPLLRVKPPKLLEPLRPRLLLCGHGDPLEAEAATALPSAIANARAGIGGMAANTVRAGGEWLRGRIGR